MTEAGKSGPISRDLAILRVDSAGNTLWTKTYNAQINATLGGVKSDDNAYSMTFTTEGSYAIVGNTQNAWDGSHVDIFFVKTDNLEQSPTTSPSISQTQSPLTIGDVSGQVKVLSPGQQEDAWTQANNNASLSQGSKIKTEENTGTLKLAGTTNLKIQPSTLIEVETLTENNNILLLHHGEFTADVENLPSGSALKVDMSQAIVEIKGTIFTVTETGTESSLSVQQGTVAFTSKFDGKTVNVLAGQNITASASGFESMPTETGTKEDTPIHPDSYICRRGGCNQCIHRQPSHPQNKKEKETKLSTSRTIAFRGGLAFCISADYLFTGLQQNSQNV